MGFIAGLLRRIIGGMWSNVPIIKERGIQWLLLFLIYAPAIYFNHYNTFIEGLLPKWLFTIIATILLIIAETKGHFPGFLCGTESLEYIEEQLAKGRKIPYHKLISWFGKIRGFEEFGREWCFWQLTLCKTICLIPVSAFLGSQFIFIGLCVAFVYNACFWVELKPFKNLMVTPTNWGEFFQGCLYFQGLIKWETLI